MNDRHDVDPQKALMNARVIWAFLVAGQLVLAAVVLVINSTTGAFIDDPMVPGMLAGVAGFILLTSVPFGLFLRGQMFKRHWQGDRIKPEGYVQGNLLAWAMIEGPATVGLIAALLGGSLWPFGLPAAVAIGVMIALWPNGRAMQPSANPEPAAHDTT